MAFGTDALQSPNPDTSGTIQAVKNAAGIFNQSSQISTNDTTVPWPVGPGPNSSIFFWASEIKALNWNLFFPYRLAVVDSKNKNQIVGGLPPGHPGHPGDPGDPGDPTIKGYKNGTLTVSSYTPASSSWVFYLPITPQQLSITDQFAINVSSTLRGTLEEHGGVRFKLINAAGTMGVWPSRTSVTTPPGSPGLIQSFLGGTLQAVGGLIQQARAVVNTALTGHPANVPVTIPPEESKGGIVSTGYYQAMLLQQFLEQYAEAKKNPANASWRLVFDIPKQNQAFVVTPIQYVWQQKADKPLEILYNFQLKAWRRISIGKTSIGTVPNPYALTPGILQRITNTITQARIVCSSAIAVIGAVRGDVDNVFNVFSQAALFVKDIGGVATTASDLPKALVQDYQSQIHSYLSSNSAAVAAALAVGGAAGAIAAMAATTALAAQTRSQDGLSAQAVSGGQLGPAATAQQQLSGTNSVFTNPNANAALLDQVPVSSLTLTTAQQNRYNTLIAAARQTSVAQLKTYQQTIQTLAFQLSRLFGAGNSTYSQTYDLPAPTTRIQPMTLDEFDILSALYDLIESFAILTATTQVNDAQIQTSMQYVAGLAAQSGIPFDIPNSKTLVPVPFGLTMEGIAARYLGDSQRWIEIATLNNLQEPYIDETGFQLPLMSNGIGRQIVVGGNDNLYLGQVVTVASNTQVPTSRKITAITQLSSSSYLITLDGNPNLSTFVTADQAYLQAYLPGTTNSQQKIYIPSDLPPPQLDGTQNVLPPVATASDPYTGISKVDWLLTEAGDLAIDSFGNFKYSFGLTNLIQALRIKLSTIRGTVITHPEFGIGLRVGMSIADTNVKNLYEEINNLIVQDPRFAGVSGLQVILNGPQLSIALNVTIAGQSGNFPIAFVLGG